MTVCLWCYKCDDDNVNCEIGLILNSSYLFLLQNSTLLMWWDRGMCSICCAKLVCHINLELRWRITEKPRKPLPLLEWSYSYWCVRLTEMFYVCMFFNFLCSPMWSDFSQINIIVFHWFVSSLGWQEMESLQTFSSEMHYSPLHSSETYMLVEKLIVQNFGKTGLFYYFKILLIIFSNNHLHDYMLIFMQITCKCSLENVTKSSEKLRKW